MLKVKMGCKKGGHERCREGGRRRKREIVHNGRRKKAWVDTRIALLFICLVLFILAEQERRGEMK